MLNLALVGSQKKGASFYKLFKEKRSLLEDLACSKLNIKYILFTENENQKIDLNLDSEKIINNFNKILLDPQVDIIIELSGDENEALENITQSLKKSKLVITDNKKVIAENYLKIMQISHNYNTKLYFSACFAPLPINILIDDFFVLDKITEVNAILNATTNYILSVMEKNTISMKETIEQAKDLSYTEENTDIDLEGLDSLYKIAIIADLIYDVAIDFTEINYKGIKGITSYDIIYAAELGYKIKLLASINKKEDDIFIGMRPNLISRDQCLAEVDGNANTVEFISELNGKNYFKANNSSYSTANLLNKDLLKAAKFIQKENNQIQSNSQEIKTTKAIDLYHRIKRSFYIRLQIEKDDKIIQEIRDLFTEKDLADLVLHDNLTETPLLPVIIITKNIEEERLETILEQIEDLPGVLTVNNIIPIKVD